MRVLLVGSGGREHALAWALARCVSCEEVHAAPGNPGIARLSECHPVRPEDSDALVELASALRPDLVVIGPEQPLVAGVADELRRTGIPVFGPSRAAARIEGSKTFAKDVLRAAGVPNATTLTEARAPCVVKADGLAAGKGVFVCPDENDVGPALAAASRLAGTVVVEELLEGPELSVFALCDGQHVVALAAARDHKRLEEGDRGPNTGGMGAFSPVPGFGADEVEELVDLIHRPVVEELARRGTPFVGVLFAGLILTAAGPRVLEFNCRFGDPETQAIMPLLEGDLLEALRGAATGDLSRTEITAGPGSAVAVVLAASGYPEGADFGTPISGIDEAEADGALVFHSGTALLDERLVTNGGRILTVSAPAEDLVEAGARAYAAADRIDFAGARRRSDIVGAAAGAYARA